MKIKWWKIILGLLVILNIYLWAAGKLYLYKALVYNFVNIDDLDLFPTRTIKAGTAIPWSIANDYNKKPLTPELKQTLEKYESVAFLVIKNDSIRYEQYWDGYSDNSLSNSFSMAKSFVGVLIGIALDEGKIKSLDQPVCDYLPVFCSDENKVLTIRHLLMMSSGLNYDESYASLFGPVTRSYYDTDLKKQMYDLKVIEKPGVEWKYLSANPQLLAFVLEKATGQKVSDYASEKLWSKVGAEHDAKWSLDYENGEEKAYCCFYSNARDFARMGKLMLNNGMYNGVRVVSENYVKASITPAPLTEKGKPFYGYGYQWWLMNYEGHNLYYARGILGQYVMVIPNLNIIFVRLGHKRWKDDVSGELLDVPVYVREVIKMYGSYN